MLKTFTKSRKRIPSALVFLAVKIIDTIYVSKNGVKKNMFIIDSRKRQKRLCSYEGF